MHQTVSLPPCSERIGEDMYDSIDGKQARILRNENTSYSVDTTTALTKEQYMELWLGLVDKCSAQQQEIEELADETIKLMRENAQNSMRAEYLTTEKDELIKVLKQARKALYAARVDVLTKETDELAREALTAIDKVIGGKEDV